MTVSSYLPARPRLAPSRRSGNPCAITAAGPRQARRTSAAVGPVAHPRDLYVRAAAWIFRAPAFSVANPARPSISRRARSAASDVASAAVSHLAVKSWGDAGVHGDFWPTPNFSSSAEIRSSRAFFTFSATCAVVGTGGRLEGGAELPDGRAERPSSPEPLHAVQKTATRPSTAAVRNTHCFIIDLSEWWRHSTGKNWKGMERILKERVR
jgi:hypothetical protein